MKKFSIALIALVSTSGLAMAQAKKAAPTAAPAAKPAATKPAPAEMPPTPPKPPAEIATSLKQAGARQKCTGSVMGGADGTTEMPFKGNSTSKTTLDGWWIQESFTGTAGTGKAAMKFKMESYRTWDGKAGKWRTASFMNDGQMMVGTAEMKDGKLEAMSDTSGWMGNGKFREHGDMTDAKAGMKMVGEMSMDNGKTWMKVYEMTCKK